MFAHVSCAVACSHLDGRLPRGEPAAHSKQATPRGARRQQATGHHRHASAKLRERRGSREAADAATVGILGTMRSASMGWRLLDCDACIRVHTSRPVEPRSIQHMSPVVARRHRRGSVIGACRQTRSFEPAQPAGLMISHGR